MLYKIKGFDSWKSFVCWKWNPFKLTNWLPCFLILCKKNYIHKNGWSWNIIHLLYHLICLFLWISDYNGSFNFIKIFENSFSSYYRKIVWCQHPLCFAITLNSIAKMTQRVSVMFSVLYNDTYVTNSQALPFTCLFIN